jgi:uncharacterized protein
MKLSSLAHRGLYFQCTSCGNCCNDLTDGVIVMYAGDIEALASFFGESKKEIAQKYLKIRSVEYNFTQHPVAKHKKPLYLDTLTLKFIGSENCIFFEITNGNNVCKIYPARPLQCKNYPLLSFVLSSNEQLASVLSDCPGISIESELNDDNDNKMKRNKKYSPTELLSIAHEEHDLEYNYYLHLKKLNFDIRKVYDFL